MSKTSGNRIVLEGRATQRVPGFSLYLTWKGSGQIGFPPKDLLFEFVGVHRESTDPRDYPDERYEIFMSQATLDRETYEEPQGDRSRKLFCSNVTPREAIEKIRDCVKHKYRDYIPQHPPAWWEPLPPADLEQIRVHNFMRMDSSRIRMEHLRDLYVKDRYVCGLFYDGVRVKAHFHGGTGTVRFDTTGKDSEGLYHEVTHVVEGIARVSPEIAQERSGTILEGYLTHPMGSAALALVMGKNASEAYAWQIEHGGVQFIVTDLIRDKDEWATRRKWKDRQTQLGIILADWQARFPNRDGQIFIQHAPYWEGEESKRAIREWAMENGYEGVRFMMVDGTYNFNGRSWEHILDLATSRYYVLVTGYENATDTKHGPMGHVSKIKVGQYDESGVLVDVGVVDPWDDTSREILSRERERWAGRVLEVESVGYTKGKTTLEKARLVGFRATLRPEHCIFGATTEVIGDE